MNQLMASIMAAVLAGVIGYAVGDYTGAARLQAEHTAELTRISNQAAQAVTDALEQVRIQEKKHADDMAALDAQHHKELQDEIDSKERAVADVRAGLVRVRDDLTCAGSTAGGAGKAGTGTRVGDGAQAGGLQSAHVEFLLREAGRADEAVKQLQACQDIVRQDRGQ